MNNLVTIVASVLMILSKKAVSFETIMVARFLYGISTGKPTRISCTYLYFSFAIDSHGELLNNTNTP